jgi:hypothetical protein
MLEATRVRISRKVESMREYVGISQSEPLTVVPVDPTLRVAR